MTPLTEEQLQDGLRAIARWGTPASTPPLPEPRPADLVPLRRVQPPRRQRAAWWGAAAAIVAALLALGVVTTIDKAPPAPVANGRWSAMAPAPIPARSLAASAWTGSEVIVVGGQDPRGGFRPDVAAYNPASNTWRQLPDAPAGIPPGASALWTGTEVVVISGTADYLAPTLANYSGQLPPPFALNPATGAWRTLPTPPFFIQAAAYVNGMLFGLAQNDNGRLTLLTLAATGQWQQIAAAPAVDMDSRRTDWLAFTSNGRAVFISTNWQTFHLKAGDPIGLVVDPLAPSVEPIPLPPMPSTEPGNLSSMVTSKVALLGDGTLLVLQRSPTEKGEVVELPVRYNLTSRTWRTTAKLRDFPRAAEFFDGMTLTAVGDDAVLFGGIAQSESPHDRGGLHRAYDAKADRWRGTKKPGIAVDRIGHVAVWTGQELVVWGGLIEPTGRLFNRADTPVDDGAVYRIGR